MTILVTGAAGFIGYHLCEKLIKQGHKIVGLDNINGYYDINLKMARLNQLGVTDIFEHKISKSKIHGDNFHFIKLNLEDQVHLPLLFKQYSFDVVCNLAAQAGVRYSIEDPMVYVESNIVGFMNLLECMRHNDVKKLVYASSSSVYGNSDKVPFEVTDNVDAPISLYAATKKTNELMAHTYSHLFKIQTIGLRFFTVYGPWGRPDMAMFLFTDAIINNKPIQVFNNGELYRDFTYIEDIVNGIIATLTQTKEKNNYSLYNIGNSHPIKLLDFILEIEKGIGKEAIKKMCPMQPGDVRSTWADVEGLKNDFDYRPKTNIQEGIKEFVMWYRKYYNQ
ncbi:NAD-dependent epimerase/dehydratase family protein [Flavobacterium capsici]|uniref:NAD-dependent epimerase/dehydratase family protein n=1 Tax=Flavobacterium capsici TaxID=3075618 RepID=A0AA96J3G2_9FLAO|nr:MULTISPECIES: NAD-dependent epimerase/dehydratase family protein [unclassified Flavobacterium]WNM20220.1 NAD-dependent epimerase/dehydratase family protein [Flavobacterium sp. PMR2A8]WNM21610.1 NAD-dependent epimerase/dehydratase family protein [Flavobacterium sp. PMTSA4]